ncbi:MAG TPA: hypothetical protein VGU25_12870 [Acidobacteriaceae bacterium]|nr:hypothetical protein [Acidobacteriaceae bacterium]
MKIERQYARLGGGWLLLPALLCATVLGRAQAPLYAAATEPYRFIAAHGRRAAIFGYAGRSLEFWGYPFQILDRYTVDFQQIGSPTILKGSNLLTSIEVGPDKVVRLWTGPGFKVSETDFVPLDEPDAIVRYEVTGVRPVNIVVRWRPELDLMWPASAGGQGVQWSDALKGYLISESTYGYKAVLASAEIEEHQPIVNNVRRETLTQTFTLRPKPHSDGKSSATVYVALVSPENDPQVAVHQLEEHAAKFAQDAEEDLQKWKSDSVSITTPDKDINRALAWADTDLDQAWACDPKIGCGAVAGFGPSRPIRRPQYDWFFAGDGMIAADAMLAAGHNSRAKEELEFILRYQSAANGMIWHEIPQSAGFLDWANNPYLYIHPDVSLQFLSTLARYYAATGDVEFLNSHWSAIHNAFQYCKSLLSPQTGLPLIPAGKTGPNEQDRMLDDQGMSASWVAAAESYAQLAHATGHTDEADLAARLSQRARASFPSRYWDATQHFWISGYDVSGRAMTVKRSGPSAALKEHLFSPEQESAMLDRLAGPAFQSDWGTRSLAAGSPNYDPNSYSKGSVSALHTAQTAVAFWDAHRPLAAWQIWSGLVPWSSMDSPGYMEEVLAGDVFQPQVESVPQQTWSSAGLLDSAISGLLGVVIDAPANRLTLAPHRFPGGGAVSIAHLRAAGASVSATIQWQSQSIEATLTNDGNPVHLEFAPEIPLGASHLVVDVNGKRAATAIKSWDEEQEARIEFVLPHGVTRCRFQYSGGAWIEVPRAEPLPGDVSRQLRIRQVALHGMELVIEADIRVGTESSLNLETPWRIVDVEGGSANALSTTRTEIHFTPATAPSGTDQYVPARLRIRFQ